MKLTRNYQLFWSERSTLQVPSFKPISGHTVMAVTGNILSQKKIKAKIFVSRENFRNTLSHKKGKSKMLMKLTPYNQFHQHTYKQLLQAQMLWRSTSIFPTILRPTLPMHSTRSYSQLLPFLLYSEGQ